VIHYPCKENSHDGIIPDTMRHKPINQLKQWFNITPTCWTQQNNESGLVFFSVCQKMLRKEHWKPW